jgi:tetratricopeptide (TPR) repeat protein
VLATAIGVVLAALSVVGQARGADNPRLERFRQWMTLVAQHQPGQVDAAVQSVQLWTAASLQDVRDDLYATRLLICARRERETAGAPCTPPPPNTRGTILPETTVLHRNRVNTREWAGIYTVNHLADLSELAPDIDRRNINDILKRGALLHTDVALRTPPMVAWSAARVEGFLMRTTVRVVDGRQSGVDLSVDHLAMARRLLDIVTPDPRRDPITYPERDRMVSDWYRATMAVLLNGQGVFLSHERAALELFRDDGEVLFQAGALHEGLAAQQWQQGVSNRRQAGVSLLESENGELRRAEQLLRQAVNVNHDHVEAHLRLGQVLGQHGRPADALVELRQVETTTQEPLLLYYAALFIGREEGSLNNVSAARAAYQRAAALFPRAQSPYIGLSELEMRSGNRPGAAQALEAVWQWGTSRQDEDDPWPSYPYAAGRSGESQLNALAKAFPPLPATP